MSRAGSTRPSTPDGSPFASSLAEAGRADLADASRGNRAVRSEERQADPREAVRAEERNIVEDAGSRGTTAEAAPVEDGRGSESEPQSKPKSESGSNPDSSESPIPVDEAPPVETPISFDGATAFSQATEVAVTGVVPVESAAPTEPTRPIDGGPVVEVANAAGSGREVASGIDGASRPTEDVASITTPRTEPGQESARFVEGGVATEGRAGGPESVARAAAIGSSGIQPAGNTVASPEADPASGPNGSSVQASANADASRAASRPVAAGLEGGRVEVSGMKSVESSATNGQVPAAANERRSAEQGDRFDRPPAVERARQLNDRIRGGQAGGAASDGAANTAVGVSPSAGSNRPGSPVAQTMPTSAATPAPTGEGEGPERTVSGVGRGLETLVRQRGGSLTMRLDPPSLGQLKVEMRMEGGRVAVLLTAATDSARSLLGDNLGSLRQALEDRGLAVDRLVVETSTRTSEGSQGSRSEHRGDGQDARGGQDTAGRQDAGDGRSRGRREDASGRRPDTSRPEVADFEEALVEAGAED